MDKSKQLEFNDLPKDTVVVYNKKYPDYHIFVQSVGRVDRFIGGGKKFLESADAVITITKTPVRQ